MPEVKRVELSKAEIDDGNYEPILDLIDNEASDIEPGNSVTLTIEVTITNDDQIEPEEETTEKETE